MYLGYKNLITHAITMLLCDNEDVRNSVLKIYRYPEKVNAAELKLNVINWFSATSYMIMGMDSRPMLASMAALQITVACLDEVDWDEVHTDLMKVMNSKPEDNVTGFNLCYERQG